MEIAVLLATLLALHVMETHLRIAYHATLNKTAPYRAHLVSAQIVASRILHPAVPAIPLA